MITANQMIAGGQARQWTVSVKPVREPSTAPAPVGTVEEAAPEAATAHRPGRAHIQQDVHHLAKAVRQDMKAELQEMKAAGTWTPEQAKAVRKLGHEFLSELHTAVKDAGRGHDFNAGAVPEGVRQAMVSLTEKLAGMNGPVAVPGGDGTAPDTSAVTPDPDPPALQGQLVDARA